MTPTAWDRPAKDSSRETITDPDEVVTDPPTNEREFEPMLEEEWRDTFIGWTIKDVQRDTITEGGLTFFLERDGEERRVILGYTELGEWLEDVTTSQKGVKPST